MVWPPATLSGFTCTHIQAGQGMLSARDAGRAKATTAAAECCVLFNVIDLCFSTVDHHHEQLLCITTCGCVFNGGQSLHHVLCLAAQAGAAAAHLRVNAEDLLDSQPCKHIRTQAAEWPYVRRKISTAGRAPV